MKSIARVFDAIAIVSGIGFLCLTENNSAAVNLAFLFCCIVSLAVRASITGRGRW